MTADNSAVPAVTIVRRIPASLAKLFAAWADTALIDRWLAAHDGRVREASVGARSGGVVYRIEVACPPAVDVYLAAGLPSCLDRLAALFADAALLAGMEAAR